MFYYNVMLIIVFFTFKSLFLQVHSRLQKHNSQIDIKI
jgi:hypothetical protein